MKLLRQPGGIKPAGRVMQYKRPDGRKKMSKTNHNVLKDTTTRSVYLAERQKFKRYCNG
jgi:hypothetical protein